MVGCCSQLLEYVIFRGVERGCIHVRQKLGVGTTIISGVRITVYLLVVGNNPGVAVAFVGLTVKSRMLQLSQEQHLILQSSKVMFWNGRVVLNSAQDASLSKETKFMMKCVRNCFFEPFLFTYALPN